jgi:hypothetical protein
MVTKITTITASELKATKDLVFDIFKNVYDNFPLERGAANLSGDFDFAGKTIEGVGKPEKIPTTIVVDKDGFQYFHPVSNVIIDYALHKMADADELVNYRTLLNVASICNEMLDNGQNQWNKIQCVACASSNVALHGSGPLIVDGVTVGDTIDNDDQLFTMYQRDEKIKQYYSSVYGTLPTVGDIFAHNIQTKTEIGIHHNVVLLTGQTNPTENGPYACRYDGGDYYLERFEDDHGRVKEGNGFVYPIATGGTTNGGKLFMCVRNDWVESELRTTKTNTWRFLRGYPVYDGVTKFGIQFREISCNSGTAAALPKPMTYIAPLAPSATLTDVQNKLNQIFAASRVAKLITT